MAERNVTVRLSAKVDAYVNAMNEAKRATDNLSKESQANLKQVGTSMVNAGQKMTAGVTLPLIGLGAAATKLGSDFNSVFGQMVGLAGVPAGEVDDLKQAVLDLSGETARAPVELAEALYFAASAGLDSAEAMDAVEVAARASAAGMGSTQDVVGLVASAVAAYGAENITAAEATDILTASIREGRAEPAELAGTLGRVLPIASQLGVSFDEVGGTVAYLSNVFGDTNRTVTATQGLFVKLVSPSQQGRDALRDMGTSVEELQAAIDQDGLMGALDLLREKGFAGNATALRALFDDIEGYQAALALLNADQADLTATLEATATAAGSTDAAFAALDQDTQAMKQAWADLQVALIQVGAVLGPIVADMAQGVSSLAGWFTDLDPTLQKIVIGVAAIGAAAGPLLIVIGSIIRNLVILQAAFAALRTAMAAHPLLLIGSVLAGAAVAFGLFGMGADKAGQKVDDLADRIRGAENAITGLNDAILSTVTDNDQLRASMEAAGLTTKDLADAIQGGDDDLRSFAERLQDGADKAGVSELEFLNLWATIDQLAQANAKAAEDQDQLNAVTDEGGAAAGRASAEEQRYIAFLEGRGKAAVEAGEDVALGAERMAAAEQSVQDALEESRKELEKLADQLRDAADAQLEMIDARRSAVDATYALRDAEDDFASAAADANEVLDSGDATLREVRQALDGAAQAAQGVADAQVRLADETAAAEGATLLATERVDLMNDSLLAQAATATGPVRQALVEHIAQLNGIPPEVASEILALIDQGKIEEAETALNNTSRSRNAAIVADAATSAAEAALNHLTRDRFVRINAQTGGAYHYASGTDFHPGGFAVVGEYGPELAWFPRGTAVTPADQTARMLSGAMTPMPYGSTPAMQPVSHTSTRSIQFGPTYVTERADADAMFAKANTALVLMGG